MDDLQSLEGQQQSFHGPQASFFLSLNGKLKFFMSIKYALITNVTFSYRLIKKIPILLKKKKIAYIPAPDIRISETENEQKSPEERPLLWAAEKIHVKELRNAPGLSSTELLGQPKQMKFPIIL